MKNNRKMILALSILASCVSLFFSSPVLAKELAKDQTCSVAQGSSQTKCGWVDVAKGHKVTILFHVHHASFNNPVCFGRGPTVNAPCQYSDGLYLRKLVTEGHKTLYLQVAQGGGGKVVIKDIIKSK